MSERYEYHVTVESDGEGYRAYVEPEPSPLSGHGDSPIAALRELVRTLADWQQGGAERWLNTPAGVTLARRFVPDFEPGRGGGQA